MIVLLQDLDRLLGSDRIGDPLQHVLERAAGQRRGMQETLQHLRRLRGVEPGGAVLPSTVDRAGDRAGGERLRPLLRDLRVNATGDRVPHEFRHAGGGAERVEHRDRAQRAALGERLLAALGGEQQVVDLRQRGHRRAAVRQQRRSEHVEGLA